MLSKTLIFSSQSMPEELQATGDENQDRYTMVVDLTRSIAETRVALSQIMMVLKYHDKNPEKPLSEIVEMVAGYTWDFSEAPDLERMYHNHGRTK